MSSSIYLESESTLSSQFGKKQQIQQQQGASSPSTPVEADSFTAGARHLNRLKLNGSPRLEESSSTADTPSSTATTSSAAPTAEDTDTVVGPSSQDQIIALLTQAGVNLGLSQEDLSEILNFTSQQAEAASEVSQNNQVNLNDQLAEQAKHEKHMRWLGFGMKAIAVTLLVVSVATGQPELAPLSTLLMTSLTALLIAKPELIENNVISPISNTLGKGLTTMFVALGVPQKQAEILGKVLGKVITLVAIVLVTAGAGAAADSGFAGKMVTDKIGRQAARETLANEGLNYAKLGAGNAMMATGGLLASTGWINEGLTKLFPNHPIIAGSVGIILTIALTLGTSIGGASLVHSSGFFNNTSFGDIEKTFKMMTHGLRGAEGVATGANGWMLYQQGNIVREITETQADQKLSFSSIQTSSALSQTTESMMNMIAQSMRDLTGAIQSLTDKGQAYASNYRKT